MPYITQVERRKFIYDSGPYYMADGSILKQVTVDISNEGELNYVVTCLLHDYIKTKGESYATYNAVIGVLECAKLELYRRRIAGYEDEKIKQTSSSASFTIRCCMKVFDEASMFSPSSMIRAIGLFQDIRLMISETVSVKTCTLVFNSTFSRIDSSSLSARKSSMVR